MKIEIRKEDFNFLKNLADKLKTQDNRATANPRYYCIQEDEIIYGIEDGYNDDYRYISEDGDIDCETLEEAIKIEEERLNSKITEDELLNDLCWQKIGIIKTHYYHNCFLTEEACEQHIKNNKHNLNNPHSYLMHAYRNPELERLINIIKEIGETND